MERFIKNPLKNPVNLVSPIPGDLAQAIQKKITLKIQALRIIRNELAELRHLRNLHALGAFLQKKMGSGFDLTLSEQLDAVQFLIDSLGNGGRSGGREY